MGKIFRKFSFHLLLLLCSCAAYGQMPNTMPGAVARDTSMNKTNNSGWKNDDPKIVYEKLGSAKQYTLDTPIHTFHRAPFIQPWYRNLGNLGGPANNLLFTPEERVGPSLGYHVYDVYRYNIDSLNFYNTRRPFSSFSYLLGSKLEQTASLSHTQNITPNWNVFAEYRKTNSRGFYNSQRSNNDNVCLSSNYKSPNTRYLLYIGGVYNKEQTDENGGVVIDTQFNSTDYGDRRIMETAYQDSKFSSQATRSPVTNILRDFTFLLQHSYQWGKTDTTYNQDSTQYTTVLLPRFSIAHRLALSTEKHTFKDVAPDSLRYANMFERQFSNGGSYAPGGDSVLIRQKWFGIDNQFLLNGFIGKQGKLLAFSAGFGTRYDRFISDPVSVLIPDTVVRYGIGKDRSDMVNNYLAGEIKKEALQPGQWEYGANTKFFITGPQAGSFRLNALIGKQLKNNLGSFSAGFSQRLNTPPYSYTTYANVYTKLTVNMQKESVTTLFATLESPRLRLAAGYKNHVINNFIFVNQQGLPDQYSGTFSISQVWVRKVFRVNFFYLDNELVFQQVPGNAPVNVPPIMGRHQLSYERGLFKNALNIAAGIEGRYNTSYKPACYNALLNKFSYQDTKSVNNTPELAVFLNFRVKKFRAFIMGDNLQEIFARNTFLYTGSPVLNYENSGINYTPVYATPDVLIRFGFTWMLLN